MNDSLKKPARLIAYEVMSGSDSASGFIEEKLSNQFEKLSLDPRDRRFIQNIVYGCIRNASLLDYLIDRETNRKPPSGGPRLFLRIGVYQLLFMDRVADHAAINETVTCSKMAGFERQSGFINGMLRNILRGRSQIDETLNALNDSEPWIRWSHPQWLYYTMCIQYNNESALQWMEHNNNPAEIYLSCNESLVSPMDLIRNLESEGCFVQIVSNEFLKSKKSLRWISGIPPQKTDAFSSGQFYVQDPSTLLAPLSVRASAGQKVLDLCAAPGGKTQLLAQWMDSNIELHASDIEQWRMDKLSENLSRLKLLEKVKLIPNSELKDQYDWILVDAPCSNTGVLRRRVELRWRINEDEASELSDLQSQILEQAQSLLKPNGILVYSTCSLLQEENENKIRQFQQKFPNFTILQQSKLLPWADEVDGAFVACLKKNI